MKPFWFAFNVTDWLSSKSVRMMSLAERGAYISLLATAWGEDVPGTLPADEDEVRRMAEMSPEQWVLSGPRLLKKFPLSECQTYRFNPRLLAEGQEQKRKSELAAEAGRRSAEAKKQRKGNGMSTSVAKKPTDVEKMATEWQLITTTVTLPSDDGNAGEPASQPAPDLKKEVVKFLPDAAQVFTLAGFRAFVEKMNFGHIDRGFYLTDIQRKAELTNQERDETGWENFVLDFLKRESAAQKLLLRDASLGENARTGVRAPQHPDAPNHKPRPEVQAQRDAEFEMQKQQRIAANFANRATEAGGNVSQPGSATRGF